MPQVRRIRCGNVNCYLITEGENAILVDTGREACRQQVLKACQAYRMRLLVLTHGHVDHIQNAAFLSERLRIPIAMSPLDVELIGSNLLRPLCAAGLPGKILLAASLRSFQRDPITPFTPSVLLEDGDTLKEYGISAVIRRLPGHTRGSIGIDVGGESFLVGDALMHMLYPSLSLIYEDKESMLQSAEKIGALGEREICFGHGRPARNRRWV